MDILNGSRVVLTDLSDTYPPEALAVLAEAGVEIVDAGSLADPVAAMQDADALLVVWYPVSAQVIRQLRRCQVIVRVGVGYDNVDTTAARTCGIPVCNVPDYCTHEVADHALALALTLARELPFLDRFLRGGGWKPGLPYPMPSLDVMTFAVVGFGRIGRAVIERARSFRFRLAACDPYVPDTEFPADVERWDLERVCAEADIVSLHVPLTAETRHILNGERLARMKPGAILVNTARGPVVDTMALAEALRSNRIAAAGVDVFETEPLPSGHPLLTCPNAVVTPHYAFYSRESFARLYRMAAQEAVRGMRGEPLRSRVA